MSESFFKKGKKLFNNRILTKNVRSIIRSNRAILISISCIFLGLILQAWGTQSYSYSARAYAADDVNVIDRVQSPLFEEQPNLFTKNNNQKQLLKVENKKDDSLNHAGLAGKLYEIVGDAPIKEMIPFISKRDERVAAFLIGIAKKESSFGEHAPSREGKDCHNYWGYKGSAGNGSVKGYACFENAEEAIEIVGNRIEVLVNKNHTTPEHMVNTWKCGTSCKGDPGAPSWVSTVALYFEKIVS